MTPAIIPFNSAIEIKTHSCNFQPLFFITIFLFSLIFNGIFAYTDLSGCVLYISRYLIVGTVLFLAFITACSFVLNDVVTLTWDDNTESSLKIQLIFFRGELF